MHIGDAMKHYVVVVFGPTLVHQRDYSIDIVAALIAAVPHGVPQNGVIVAALATTSEDIPQ